MGLVGTMSSWFKKLISGKGVLIGMSLYAFFEKINSRGDVYFGLERR